MIDCGLHRQQRQHCFTGSARSNFVQLSNGAVLTLLQAPRFRGNPRDPRPAGIDAIPRRPAANGAGSDNDRRRKPKCATCPAGSRENIIVANYNPNFALLNMGDNNPGRIIQFALKIYW